MASPSQVPHDRLDANHLARDRRWVEGASRRLVGHRPDRRRTYQAPKLTSRQRILDLFDRNVAAPGRRLRWCKTTR